MMAGSLMVVGTGAEPPGSTLSDDAVKAVQAAEKVLYLVFEPAIERALKELRPGAESLQPLFREGGLKDAYLEMAEWALQRVRLGRAVTVLFWGSAARQPAHVTVNAALLDGFRACMIPAASQHDWLGEPV